MKKIVLKDLSRIIIVTVVIILFLMIFGRRSEGSDLNLNGNYYEKNGCIYLTGNLTEVEKTKDLEYYKERMVERSRQVDKEIYRNHDIEIEKIRAKALENYLIAQSLDYSKIAEVIRQRRYNTNVNIGNITSQSNFSVDDVTSTASTGTITNTNSAAGGSGGTSTHNNYQNKKDK